MLARLVDALLRGISDVRSPERLAQPVGAIHKGAVHVFLWQSVTNFGMVSGPLPHVTM